ncbi:MAG: redoxin family protein, partial [Methyloceanibacter sp.]
GLVGLFWLALHGGDPSTLPSALIGKLVPQFALPPIEGLATDGGGAQGFGTSDLATGKPIVVNVWASWCVPCHEEHPLLLALVFAIAARGLAPSVADLAERRLIPLRSSSASKWR